MEIESGFQTESRPIPSELYHNRALLGRLIAAAAAGRLCHAYLFYGERGIGKKTFARHFAAALLCRKNGMSSEKDAELLFDEFSQEALSPEKLPCKECAVCRKAFEGNHPDLILYEGKRGANAFHIDAVRAIRQDAYLLPNESEYKIYILPNVEDMSPGAANAFLKVLEEPPQHVIFLLTADNPERVMETVRSRCILQELYPMGDAELATALEELYPQKNAVERADAVRMADGLLGRAADMLDSEDYSEISSLAERLSNSLASRNEYDVLAALTGANQNKERLLLLLSCISHHLRSALMERLSGTTETAGLSYRLSVLQMERVCAVLEEARIAVNGNANLGLLTNYLSLNLMKAVGQRD